jgi:hypothetical protein
MATNPLHEDGLVSGITQRTWAPTAVTPVDNGAQTTVRDGWERSLEYSDLALTTAINFIAKLSAISVALPVINPNLTGLNLEIARFSSMLGNAPASPANNFAFTEIPYSSNLLTDLRARLLEWVDGKSTGILPSVEQAIYDRGRAREVAVSNRKAQEAIRSFAMRGFPKPPGALSIEIQDAAQEAQNNSVTLNREIIIKQAELEQSNRRFSFEQAGKMEDALIAYTNQQAQRVIDSAKALQQFTIEIFQQQVAEYGVNTQGYSARVGAEVSTFKAKTDVQVAEANIRMEAARVSMQAYIQQVTLQVEAMKAGATVSAQLAASALSAVNISAGLSSQVSESAQNSTQYQASAHIGQTIALQAAYNYSGSV